MLYCVIEMLKFNSNAKQTTELCTLYCLFSLPVSEKPPGVCV